jgi:hypothetical protein
MQRAPTVKRRSALLPVPFQRPAQMVVPACTVHRRVRVLVHVFRALGQVSVRVLTILTT